MKRGLVVILIAVAVVLILFGIFHKSVISSFYGSGLDQSHGFENKTLWKDNISVTGTGSCTTREECETMLGKGAFCSSGKCFPAPSDYDPNMAQCYCPDGSKIKAIDCRWIDCPNEKTTPTEFTVKNGIVSKVTVDINFPLSGNEAKKVAIAACGLSEQTSIPNSPYENIISECSPTWSFLDESNPCNNKEAFICGNQSFASCKFGEMSSSSWCINGTIVFQGEYNSKFIVANPLDLSQVEKFSRYRSCLGHDYSGFNENNELETQRSMKQGGLARSGITKMNIYSPFNGTVIKYASVPGNDDPAEEHSIEIVGDYSGKWFITFGHFTAKQGLDTGSRVTAGEFIGTSTIHPDISPDGDGVELGLSKDLSTETIKEQFMRGAILDYADNKILAEYASYGLNPDNTKYTKEYRDAHPCDFTKIGSDPNDFVILNSS